MVRKKEYPEIGDRKTGQTLVAMGDDFPDQWISWLDDLVGEYGEVVSLFESVNICVEGLDLSDSSSSRMEFAEALGVEFSSTFWEGDHISGHFQMGWIPTKEIPKAKKAGKLLLKQRMESIRSKLIKDIISNLNHLDLEALVARVASDPIKLKAEIDYLKKDAKLAEDNRINMLSLIEQRANDVSAAALASQECITLALSMQNATETPIVAGPIALWRGEIFSICSQGGVVPPASPYDDLIGCLRSSCRTIIEVHDETIAARSPFSGRVTLIKGSSQIAYWRNIWLMKTPHMRILNADTQEKSQKAMDLYHILLKH